MSTIKLSQNQSGLVSIIVAITFVSILALISTSFVLLSRREARQALDRQLSTQAFYAAESGVNDAIHKLDGDDLSTDVDTCAQVTLIGEPDLENNLRYTCVLVDRQPESLDYSSVGTEESILVKVQTSDGSDIQTLQFGWQSEDSSNVFTNFSNHQLPDKNNPKNGLDQTGIVRATIIPGEAPFTRAELTEDSSTYFLYPKANPGATGQVGWTAYAPGRADSGRFIDGECNENNTPRFCNAEVRNLNSLGTSTLYIRLKSIYRASQVTIRAKLAGSDQQAAFKDSQAVIDSTGRANDILRRIQVRVPLDSSYYYPEFGLETGDDICKFMNIPDGLPVADYCP